MTVFVHEREKVWVPEKTKRLPFLKAAQPYNTPTPHQPAICAINTSANENLPPEAAAYISLGNSALSRPSLNLTLHTLLARARVGITLLRKKLLWTWPDRHKINFKTQLHSQNEKHKFLTVAFGIQELILYISVFFIGFWWCQAVFIKKGIFMSLAQFYKYKGELCQT